MDVAIVGMACVMPGAADVEQFWANVVDGVDSVTEVPASRWDQARHFDPSPADERESMSVSKWGGFVPDVGFDALAWGIPPASLASIDPAQLLALKCAGAALDDAGYDSGAGRPFDRERTSVVYATGSGGAADLAAGFQLRVLLRSHGISADSLPPELHAFLPELTEDGLPGVLTSVIAGRVANRLDLGGKNLTVDSACASVLVGLDIACTELAARSSDMVLLGGVDLHNGVTDYVSFTAAKALSPTGRCRSFDADADGMTLAEGVGCVVLKRLADAEADGDRIYAVVRGVAGSSDGRHLGLTAPRQEGQMRAVRRAYGRTGISPAEVGMVEAHGTGTATGDRVELSTTTEIFTAAGAVPGSVVLGSVKSNIGHTKCASAMASLIKAARAAYHGVLPPTLHINKPIDEYDPVTSPFTFLDQARPWEAERRLVGVSSFGFGGTNFHAIVESHGPPAPSARSHWPAELFLFRSAATLDALATRLADEVGAAGARQADRWRLRDIAFAVSTGDGDGPVQVAIVAGDLDDLAAKVDAARTGRSVPGVHRPGGDAPPGGVSLTDAQVADLVVAFPSLRGTPADRVPAAALALFGVSIGSDGRPVPSDDGRHGVVALLDVVARVAVAGDDVDIPALWAGRGAEAERWASPGRAPGWIVNGHYARMASGASLPKGLHPANQAPVVHLGDRETAAASVPAPLQGLDAGDVAVVAEYLRIVQGMLATGQEIIRAHAPSGALQ